MEPSSTVIKDKKDAGNMSIQPKSAGFGASNPDYLKNCLQDSKITYETIDYDSTSSSDSQNEILKAIHECPFNGHTCMSASRVLPLKRRYNHNNGLCGDHPITGPCYTSKQKYDYDLCNICSEEMGQDVDIRIDLPVISRCSSHLNGCHNHVNLILPRVCNDKNDPEVVSNEMDQDNELFENKFIGVVELEDTFFKALPHKDQETNVLLNGAFITSNDSVSKSNSEFVSMDLAISEVTNVVLVHSPSMESLDK